MSEKESSSVLLPKDASVLVIVDPQNPITDAVRSMEPSLLRCNVLTVARAAFTLGVPVVATTVTRDEFGVEIWSELQDRPDQVSVLKRHGFNPFSGTALRQKLNELNRSRIVFAGAWTEGCFTHAALAALKFGYEVQIAVDCAASTSLTAHDYALQRLVQAGCVPVSWRQLLYEWQQSWDHTSPSKVIAELIRNHPETETPLRNYLDQATA